MKLTRILSIPVAVVADLCTLGNMGDRSFTQQVFDGDRRDQEVEMVARLVKALEGERK